MRNKNVMKIVLLAIIFFGIVNYLIINNSIKNSEVCKSKEKFDENSFIRNDIVSFSDDNSSNLVEASIDNGNILFSSSNKKFTISANDAKYLYKTFVKENNMVYLFYITDSGELFVINNVYNMVKSDNIKNGDIIKVGDVKNYTLDNSNIIKLSSRYDVIKEFIGDFQPRDEDANQYGYLNYEILVVDENNMKRGFIYFFESIR